VLNLKSLGCVITSSDSGSESESHWQLKPEAAVPVGASNSEVASESLLGARATGTATSLALHLRVVPSLLGPDCALLLAALT
jgi:hypothetical protein